MSDEYEYDYESDGEEYRYSDDEIGSNDDGSAADGNATDTDWNPSSLAGIVSDSPSAAPAMSGNQKGIRLLESEDVFPDMKRRRKDVAEILDIPQSATCALLREHKWSKERCIEVFMEDSERLQKKCGVFHRCNPKPPPKSSPGDDNCCPICYDEMKEGSTMAMPCGHEFCMDCWHDFCVNAIQQEGPSCVFVTCPDSNCTEVVTEIEVKKAAPECLARFQTFQLRNFVESNTLTRWCPGVGCEKIACASTPGAMEKDGSIAHCSGCSTSFCMVCGEEPHGPTTCRDLGRWKVKCRDESETANWMLANTKSCPKCSARIEKNMGCNHMTCRKCNHEFCWICLEDWKTHSGGYYKCNKFDSSKTDNAAKAKQELERYLHYYKRFHAHCEAQKFAKKQLEETESKRLQESLKSSKWTDAGFLEAANEQLVECRRVLKYTYVHAYYMAPSSEIEKQRFEHHQEMLEKFTENLSHESEKPIDEMDQASVVNQTAVVDRFIKNILKYVDEGVDG